MAKKQIETKAKNVPITTPPVVPEQEANPILDLRQAFYAKFNRQIKLSDDEIIALDDNTGQGEEWWFGAVQKAEEDKLRSEMQGDGMSISQMVERMNADREVQEYAYKFAEATDLPAKAPAHLAWRISKDFSYKERQSFAVPFSNQETHRDGDGNPIGDNQRPGYRWDKQHRKTASGETITPVWFEDFVDGTSAGERLNNVINALDKNELHEGKTEVPIVVDGIALDVLNLDKATKGQRITLHDMFRNRRNRLIKAYRMAVQILNMMDELKSRLGNKYADDGQTITTIGKVHVDWVYQDETNRDKGLAPSKAPIRITHIHQEDIKVMDGEKEIVLHKAGSLSTTAWQDFRVAEFINLSIDAAYLAADKVGKDVTYRDIITSKKVKKATTPPGDKAPADKKETPALTKPPAAGAMVDVFTNLRLQVQNEGFRKAWTEKFANLDSEVAKTVCYDMVEVSNWLSNLITKTVLEIHDQEQKRIEDAETKERDDRLKQLAS